MQQPVVVDCLVLFRSSLFLCYCCCPPSLAGGVCSWVDYQISLFAYYLVWPPTQPQPLRLSSLLSPFNLQSHCTILPCSLRLFSMQQKCTSLFSFSPSIHPSASEKKLILSIDSKSPNKEIGWATQSVSYHPHVAILGSTGQMLSFFRNIQHSEVETRDSVLWVIYNEAAPLGVDRTRRASIMFEYY